jgi:hypothetical protein
VPVCGRRDSETSVQALLGQDKDVGPFWQEEWEEMYANLSLPIETETADLPILHDLNTARKRRFLKGMPSTFGACHYSYS